MRSHKGWKPGKFVVKHYRRGDIMDGEAFVLVPERDPAAIVALRAYADTTPDPELALRLRKWADQIDGSCEMTATAAPEVLDKLPSWIASLVAACEAGETTIDRSLWKLAHWMLAER